MSTGPREAHRRLVELSEDGTVEALCARLGIDLLVVFGSAVDPEANPADLDVAVLLAAGSTTSAVDVANALIDLLHSDALDVMDLGNASVVAQEQALVGTQPLYESSPGRYAALRDRAMVLRMETEWLRRLDLELMAGR